MDLSNVVITPQIINVAIVIVIPNITSIIIFSPIRNNSPFHQWSINQKIAAPDSRKLNQRWCVFPFQLVMLFLITPCTIAAIVGTTKQTIPLSPFLIF